MKRKDMVQKIQDAVERHLNTDPETGELLLPPGNYIGLMVLEAMERAGMQPPRVRHTVVPHDMHEFSYSEWIAQWDEHETK